MKNIDTLIRENGVPAEQENPFGVQRHHQVGTAIAEAEPEAPPEKPRLRALIGSIFQREKQSARAQYLALVKKSAGRELSAREIETLAVAMKGAGISEAELAKHQDLIESLAPAREAVEKQRAADEKVKTTYSALAAFDEPVREILAKQQAARLSYEDAAGSANVHRGAAEKLQEIEELVAKLFGEAV